MATISQREALKGTESSSTTEQKNRLLFEFDANVKKIRELQIERSYIFKTDRARDVNRALNRRISLFVEQSIPLLND
ncbi:unnamed protein product [Brachionus calyciflorus]|uniref:Uncharacterized protein n=1 Tax=Brachionus calyciflorus TaxID=104777 RepID=A0A813TJ11_9BILA|nr:unnamed protein product [Brachionus calyciflorus]